MNKNIFSNLPLFLSFFKLGGGGGTLVCPAPSAYAKLRPTPEGGREDHAVVGLRHLAAVAAVRAEVKARLLSILIHRIDSKEID